MYHIKQDKRARESAELICSAVLQLMEEKPFSRITVSDIHRVSTVSRSTFYRNFDQIEDVLELLCDRGFEQVFSEPEEAGIPLAVFRYWSDHSVILEALVSIHRADILHASFRRSAARLKGLSKTVVDPRQYDYFVSINTSIMIGILFTWVEHGKCEPREEVLELVKHAFSSMTWLHAP